MLPRDSKGKQQYLEKELHHGQKRYNCKQLKDRGAEKPEMQCPKATPVVGEKVLADRLAGPETPGRWSGSPGGEQLIKTLQITVFSKTRLII